MSWQGGRHPVRRPQLRCAARLAAVPRPSRLEARGISARLHFPRVRQADPHRIHRRRNRAALVTTTIARVVLLLALFENFLDDAHTCR